MLAALNYILVLHLISIDPNCKSHDYAHTYVHTGGQVRDRVLDEERLLLHHSCSLTFVTVWRQNVQAVSSHVKSAGGHVIYIVYDLYSLCTYQCNAPGTTPRAKGGDLTYMKSIPSPPGADARIKCPPPLGLHIFAPLFVNIDQILLIQGMFSGQNEIKSPPFASRGVGGAIL